MLGVPALEGPPIKRAGSKRARGHKVQSRAPSKRRAGQKDAWLPAAQSPLPGGTWQSAKWCTRQDQTRWRREDCGHGTFCCVPPVAQAGTRKPA
eukprot:1344276-Amphidinium_carterae.1